jgi:gluconate 2-dehydrogenase gamma chain
MRNEADPAIDDPARRCFLGQSGATLGAAWLAANGALLSAAARAAVETRTAAAGYRHLGNAEAADFAAIAARIVPSDEGPGATEAGVIWFIDAALGGFAADKAAALREGLAALNASLGGNGPARRFASLDASAQDLALGAIDGTPFFEALRFLTLAGLLVNPDYGGNRDHVGWQLIGFEHRHAWQPPFGHYDAEAAKEGPAHG